MKNQPIQLSEPIEHRFESFEFGRPFSGYVYKTAGYVLKGKFTNISSKTFVTAEFTDRNVTFWADAMHNPYVEIKLNNIMRLSCVNFGSAFGNWNKIWKIGIPEVDFKSPWRPSEEKTVTLYFQPDITCGYYLGVDDYGKMLERVHFQYEPTECTLIIPIYLEDAQGYKLQEYLRFDILEDYKEFGKELENN